MLNPAIAEPPQPHEPATRRAQGCHFVTHDGQRLFYRYWPALTARPRGCIALFHRGHEYGGRMAHLVDELDLPDMAFVAWDARGHGRSPGPRGYSPSFSHSVRDVQTFMDHLLAHHGLALQDIYVVAQSVGAVVAATWVHDHAPGIRGMTLASPAFDVRLYVPFARSAIRLRQAVAGPFYVNSYVKAGLLTHDPERIASHQSDPLIARPIASHVLLGLHAAAGRVVSDAAAITVPTQVLVSGSDWVVNKKPQQQFHDRLGSPTKDWFECPGFFHDTLGEKNRAPVVARIRSFVLEQFSQPLQRVDARHADLTGFTHDEALKLGQPLPAWSPEGLWWRMVKMNLRIGGLLSEGIRLGHATGFDSGSTLDFVYRNQPQGRGPIGRLIDRVYLNAIGWRGIRQRKLHVQELLSKAMSQVRQMGLPVRVFDMAAGHGRYVLDAVMASPDKPDRILLRDYSPLNVSAGQSLIESRGLSATCQFEHGDAFDRTALSTMTPAPTVAVISGLYELFSDNDQVSASLSGLAQAMPPGAVLVYTGQPWHPQLALIARGLTSHRAGQAWVMRRRTQHELDQLVADAGFVKVAQRIDEWGIFTVSMAVRAGAAL